MEIKLNDNVEVIAGKYEGYIGKVTELKSRGWVSIEIDDHGTVNVRNSELDVRIEDDDTSKQKSHLSSQIRKYRDQYELGISAGGHVSRNCGDEVATMLRGKSLEQIWEYVENNISDVNWAEKRIKYAKLNTGHQRMILGNIIRARFNTIHGGNSGQV